MLKNESETWGKGGAGCDCFNVMRRRRWSNLLPSHNTTTARALSSGDSGCCPWAKKIDRLLLPAQQLSLKYVLFDQNMAKVTIILRILPLMAISGYFPLLMSS